MLSSPGPPNPPERTTACLQCSPPRKSHPIMCLACPIPEHPWSAQPQPVLTMPTLHIVEYQSILVVLNCKCPCSRGPVFSKACRGIPSKEFAHAIWRGTSNKNQQRPTKGQQYSEDSCRAGPPPSDSHNNRRW